MCVVEVSSDWVIAPPGGSAGSTQARTDVIRPSAPCGSSDRGPLGGRSRGHNGDVTVCLA